ncbi:MAG: HAMP domain-containing histidine kinase [Hamadaea sp.]|uniref:sensor histidine kinase n=1 Tax=Hamadaea sp. TaxID=2024425 RepID=UPI001854EE38|nr:HAMP domain-containing sensor histidine kinase [Hamadaea sp.]NUT18056.1 HAMP domain-containing histidine kinase [Hamadaea sp.]
MIRLRRPIRGGTVGRRFTLLYAGVFLVSGAGLLGLTILLAGGVSSTQPAPNGTTTTANLQEHIRALEDQLASVHDEQNRQLIMGALIAMIAMAGVSLLLGGALARRVLRPLRTLTAATRRISADSLDRRLAVEGPADEVKDLADTIDELLGRLETSFDAQRRFVANASHELRTPLATMRASLDVAVAKPDVPPATVALADRMRTQLDRVDHLLDGFLVLARAQHGALADTAPVGLRDLVGAALAARPAEGLTVTVDVPEGIEVEGSPALLARLVGNLVDNAVVHNEPSGFIAVSAFTRDGHAELVVETSGEAFEQSQVDRLGRPFERLGVERTGSSGLGLSIVAAVAAAHGGRLTLTARPGGGLRATVTLPLAATVAVP